MPQTRQDGDTGIVVRFWSLDHHRAEEVLWSTSSWWKVVFASMGTLHAETSRELHLLPPNRALLVQPNEPISARTLGPAKVRTLYFAPHLDLSREPRILEVRPLFRELISEACRVGPLRAGARTDMALATLLLAEVQSARHIPTSIPMPQTDWLRQWAVRFLANPSNLAFGGYSRRTFERRIHTETGLTLGQWSQQARALVGLQALSRGASVIEAAIEAGFETSGGFIQAFRRQFGTTPGRMRQSRD